MALGQIPWGAGRRLDPLGQIFVWEHSASPDGALGCVCRCHGKFSHSLRKFPFADPGHEALMDGGRIEVHSQPVGSTNLVQDPDLVADLLDQEQ